MVDILRYIRINNPLTYILITAKLDAPGQRWVASLSNYNFKIFYRSGKLNVEADALLRIPWENTSMDHMKICGHEKLCNNQNWQPI